jgi:hypothetical protein
MASLLLVSLALAACATAPQPTPRPPAYPSDTPRLLIRLDLGMGGYPGFPYAHDLDYQTDGTVIQVRGGTLERAGTMQRNRLTEAGLAKLVATVGAAGDLLERPLRIEPRSTIIPVSSTNPSMPMSLSEGVNTFVLQRPNGSRYTVSAPGRPRLAGAAPDPTVDRLIALADALRDPDALVGPGGLVGPWETYEATGIAVFLILQTIDHQFVTDGVIPHIKPSDWTFEGTPDTFGTEFNGPGTVTRRCALLSSADAAPAIERLSKVGGGYVDGLAARQIASGLTWGTEVLLWVGGNQATSVYLQARALMPEDGGVSCLDALSL